MAAEDLARALIRLDNEYVTPGGGTGRPREPRGFDFELSDEERELLLATAGSVARDEQLPVTQLGERPGQIEPGGGGPGRGWGYWPPGTARAIEYVRERLRDPQLQASFAAWQDLRGDKVP